MPLRVSWLLVRRLLFVLCLFCVVATLGGWSLGADGAEVPDGGDGKAAVTAGVTVTDDQASEPASSSSEPCIVRANCAGGGLLVGQPLMLVVPAALLVTLALVLVGQAARPGAALNPVLLAARLDRPPQLSS